MERINCGQIVGSQSFREKPYSSNYSSNYNFNNSIENNYQFNESNESPQVIKNHRNPYDEAPVMMLTLNLQNLSIVNSNNINNVKEDCLLSEDECVKIVAYFLLYRRDEGAIPNEKEAAAYFRIMEHWSEDRVTQNFLEGMHEPIKRKYSSENSSKSDTLDLALKSVHFPDRFFCFDEENN